MLVFIKPCAAKQTLFWSQPRWAIHAVRRQYGSNFNNMLEVMLHFRIQLKNSEQALLVQFGHF